MTLTPEPLILQGFRGLCFKIDTTFDTASQEALFTLIVCS